MDRNAAPSSLASGRIDGWREFQERFRSMLSTATAASGETAQVRIEGAGLVTVEAAR